MIQLVQCWESYRLTTVQRVCRNSVHRFCGCFKRLGGGASIRVEGMVESLDAPESPHWLILWTESIFNHEIHVEPESVAFTFTVEVE